ncbi:peroxidase family protein [Demequina soli]|uniref:peroxidase family protein n=1 Tax=Demequina soli TaxID=1638987 RepID=UPI000784DB70|nr:peroxidase family protein [Demequina soli]
MAHGDQPISALAPRSRLYQGPFGRLFPDLPAWPPEDMTDAEATTRFTALAETMIERPGRTAAAIAKGAGDHDSFDGPIPAGYTYFGQFVDHDITFDPASSLVRANDPNGLLNFRTPRLDLDNLYGRGPDDQPYLFDGGRFVLGRAHDAHGRAVRIPGAGTAKDPRFFADLQRNARGIAIIGDPRNDENVIVSQLQVAFLLAHNALMDRAVARGADRRAAFGQARTTLRRLYQWIVWHDFLRRVCDPDVWAQALTVSPPDAAGRRTVTLGFPDVYSWKAQPFMPVEFSAAAYRFGHSMIRTEYRTNLHRGLSAHVPVFLPGEHPDDLRGHRPLLLRNVVQWDWFLPMVSSVADAGFPQRAHRIDAKVSNALVSLPERPSLLPMRNLKRGWRLGLPSGSDVARHLGIAPITIDPARDSLWLYVLTEAGGAPKGRHLGKVGSILVCATIAGLLRGDPGSWLATDPGWTPGKDPLLHKADNVDGRADTPDQPWTLAAILRIAGVPVDAEPFAALDGFPPGE